MFNYLQGLTYVNTPILLLWERVGERDGVGFNNVPAFFFFFLQQQFEGKSLGGDKTDFFFFFARCSGKEMRDRSTCLFIPLCVLRCEVHLSTNSTLASSPGPCP